MLPLITLNNSFIDSGRVSCAGSARGSGNDVINVSHGISPNLNKWSVTRKIKRQIDFFMKLLIFTNNKWTNYVGNCKESNLKYFPHRLLASVNVFLWFFTMFHLHVIFFGYLYLWAFLLVLQALFQSAQHIYEKRKGSGTGSEIFKTERNVPVGKL